ncbi:hypothetical protein [Acinetobacter sp.]|uniref:hypothetical protein n=1 Tax=Acinetobacter sp. TaxID=472 RepID=UPI00388F4966
MYDFHCPFCSWGMDREDINDQVHEDDHVGEWEVKCNHCKKDFTLEAQPSIDYFVRIKKTQQTTSF